MSNDGSALPGVPIHGSRHGSGHDERNGNSSGHSLVDSNGDGVTISGEVHKGA